MRRRAFRWLLGGALSLVVLSLAIWAALRVPSVYLRVALVVIQYEAYYRDRVDWARVRAECFALARGARSTKDTYPAIQHALAVLHDRHSFLMPPISPAVQRSAALGNRPPSAREVGADIGYLDLPSLSGSGRLSDGRQYAVVAHMEIRRLDSKRPRCGWIVDLRRNEGGNMWPMLAAIGPILGEGEVGSFEKRGMRSRWSYASGTALLAGRVTARVGKPYVLVQPLPPVAILQGPRTASSGEAIVVAFRGRPHVRFFGEPTAGVPTANQPFPLPDGAKLLLMVGLDADRQGRSYDGPIPPDAPVHVEPSDVGLNTDAAIEAAADWLRSQPSCINEATNKRVTGLGNRGRAFVWLERDFEQHSGQLPVITWRFPFENLRSDPRYADLVRHMGLRP